jgi:NitT/TauT family transport system substrate-binding protein
VEFVRTHPDESRRSLDGFTAIDATLVKEVPLSGFTLYNEVPTPRPGLDWP